MSTTTARKLYKVLGTTDEITECEHCGRVDLKGTIRLGILDEDGNVEDVTYFGAVCGARAAGWTTKDIREAAEVADRETTIARDADLAAYVRATYGVSIQTVRDLAATSIRRATGKRPIEVVEEFKAVKGGGSNG